MAETKTLLINFPLRSPELYRNFPLGLNLVAAALRESGREIDILDLVSHPRTPAEIRKVLSKKYDYILTGSLSTGYKALWELSRLIKKSSPGSKLIVGNALGTHAAQTILKHSPVDIAARGEGERLIVELLDTLDAGNSLKDVPGLSFKQRGKILSTVEHPLEQKLDSLPMADHRHYDLEFYLKNAAQILPQARHSERGFLPLYFSRGCVAACTFCSMVARKNGHPDYRRRSSKSVLTEIDTQMQRHSVRFFKFFDDLTFKSCDEIEDFCDALQDSKLKFSWSASTRGNLFKSTKHLSLVKHMKKLGCFELTSSLESGSSIILSAMRKGFEPEQYLAHFSVLKAAGLTPTTNLVFGYPQETEQTIRETFNFCLLNSIPARYAFLMPLPGSTLFLELQKNGIIPKDPHSYLMKLRDSSRPTLSLGPLGKTKLAQTVLMHYKRLSIICD